MNALSHPLLKHLAQQCGIFGEILSKYYDFMIGLFKQTCFDSSLIWKFKGVNANHANSDMNIEWRFVCLSLKVIIFARLLFVS